MRASEWSAQTPSAMPPPPEATASLAAALAHKQAELELLGHAISHDLRAPVRILLGLCEELSSHRALAMDVSAQEIALAISEEAERLRVMMDGMLEYVRLETFTTSVAPVEGDALVEAVREMLQDQIAANGATVTSDPLPQVAGHRGRLTRLLLALVDNALKFRGDAAPVIHIAARPAGDQWEFSVADNGIGMAEEDQPMIYTLYRRLHADDVYPGQGIGLALAAKIVAAHGGKLWVESAPGKGSVFRFTLPAPQDRIQGRPL